MDSSKNSLCSARFEQQGSMDKQGDATETSLCGKRLIFGAWSQAQLLVVNVGVRLCAWYIVCMLQVVCWRAGVNQDRVPDKAPNHFTARSTQIGVAQARNPFGFRCQNSYFRSGVLCMHTKVIRKMPDV